VVDAWAGSVYTKKGFCIANARLPYYDISNNITGETQHIHQLGKNWILLITPIYAKVSHSKIVAESSHQVRSQRDYLPSLDLSINQAKQQSTKYCVGLSGLLSLLRVLL
jgi:hypothetical protein